MRRPALRASDTAREPLLPGVTLADDLRGSTLTLRLQGKGVTPALREAVIGLLRRELGGYEDPRIRPLSAGHAGTAPL